MTMPRLSLFRPEKGNDYKFIDRQISEMFQVGGVDLYVHKYLGPRNPTDNEATADQPQYANQSVTNIQDLLLLENRDRKYDPSIYRSRGVYNVQDIDFNLSQFGIFIDNDNVIMTVHINDWIKTIGRKPISGDVIEIPNLKDEFALNIGDVSLPRYYSIEDVGRAAEGFSQTWWPHLYRLKLKKVIDSQQFADILTAPTDTDANFRGDYDNATAYKVGDIVRYQGSLYTVTADTTGNSPPDSNYFNLYSGNTLQDILSTKNKFLEINDSVIAQAESDAPKSGQETRQFFTIAVDENGVPLLRTADETDVDVSQFTSHSPDASSIRERPDRSGYSGYLVGDGYPPNGVVFGHGISFPAQPRQDDWFLRTDMMPNRLFYYDGSRWVKREDDIRHTLTNTDTRHTLKTSFINNQEKSFIGQLVSDLIKIKTSNTFRPTDPTASLTINNTANTTTIETKTPYNAEYGVKILINGVRAQQSQVTVFESNNNIGITVSQALAVGDKIEWKIYNEVVEQRQAISKAIKPRADF